MIDARTAADLIGALRYYAAPSTYESVRVMADPPCGDFQFDYADREDSYGHVGRAGLAAVAARLGLDDSDVEQMIEAPSGREADGALMERLGIDMADRYDPKPIAKDHPDYDPRWHDRSPCCKQAPAMISGRVQVDGLTDTCPLCLSPMDPEGFSNKLHGTDEQRTYLCGLSLYPCGHYSHGMFDRGESCAYVQALRLIGEGRPSPIEALERFKESIDGDDSWGLSLLKGIDRNTISIHVYRREGRDTQLPEKFEGLPIIIEQIEPSKI